MSDDSPHRKLCERAATWLANTERCIVVLVEPVSGTVHEMPDVFGWNSGGVSVLVECKTSRSDFHADKSKPSRRLPSGMGTRRYYLAPSGVLKASDMPDGWGLLTVAPSMKRVSVVQPAAVRPMDEMRSRWETRLLAASVRRSHNYERVLRLSAAPRETEGK